MFYSIYEIGYIENDIVTVKKEKNPTIRLNRENNKYIKKNYSKIIISKYLIFLISLAFLSWIDLWIEYVLNIKYFIIHVLLTRLIFFCHNYFRNRFTIVTFFLLSISKFTFPLILFIDLEIINYALLLSITIFPILRTIEIFLLKRFQLKFIAKFIKDIDKFRILYYLVFFCLTLVLYFFDIVNSYQFYIGITIVTYFLIFRIVCYFLIKGSIYNRDKKVKNKFQNKFR